MATRKDTARRVKKHARRLKALTRSLRRLEERLGALEEQTGRTHASMRQAAEDAAAAREDMRAMRDASLMEPPTQAQLDHRDRRAQRERAAAEGAARRHSAIRAAMRHGDGAAPVLTVAQADAVADRPMDDDAPPADPAPDRWPAFDQARLQAMEARLAARSPGAWRAVSTDDGPVVARDDAWSHRIATTPEAADAHLIAHTPGDLEWLIRELRHSWGREAAWRDTAAMWREWHAHTLPALRDAHTATPHASHVTRPGMHMALIAAVLAALAWWLA